MEKNNTDSTNLVSQQIISDDILDGQVLISQVEAQDSNLSELEVSSLLLMREEEKLARDVYL
jgi:hypothetical protein